MVESTIRDYEAVSLALVRAIARAEASDDLHMARLLLLLRAKDAGRGHSIEGITKLVKLDFLLRYPNCLERALAAVGRDPASAHVQEFERTTIESTMIRFKYGPWDARYRRWLGLMVGLGLSAAYVKGRTVYVSLTDDGRKVAGEFGRVDSFRSLQERSEIAIKAFGAMSATKIKEFIYATFPELTSMELGEEIVI